MMSTGRATSAVKVGSEREITTEIKQGVYIIANFERDAKYAYFVVLW